MSRYDSGTRLGTGGLIRAYGRVVSEVIDKIRIVERRERRMLNVSVAHTDAGQFEHAVRASGFQFGGVTYAGSGATFEMQAAEIELPALLSWITGQTAGRAMIRDAGTTFVDAPVHATAPG